MSQISCDFMKNLRASSPLIVSQSIVTLKMALPFIHYVNTKKKGKISPSNYNNFHFENKPLICEQFNSLPQSVQG